MLMTALVSCSGAEELYACEREVEHATISRFSFSEIAEQISHFHQKKSNGLQSACARSNSKTACALVTAAVNIW